MVVAELPLAALPAPTPVLGVEDFGNHLSAVMVTFVAADCSEAVEESVSSIAGATSIFWQVIAAFVDFVAEQHAAISTADDVAVARSAALLAAHA